MLRLIAPVVATLTLATVGSSLAQASWRPRLDAVSNGALTAVTDGTSNTIMT
jgi:hypothetical protein